MRTEMTVQIHLTKDQLEVIMLLKSKYTSVETYLRGCIKLQIIELKSELYSRKINYKQVAKKIQELELEIALLKNSNNNTNTNR